MSSGLILNDSVQQAVNLTSADKVHPVIRIISFLVFAGFVSLAGSGQLLTGGLLMIGLYGLTNPGYLMSAWEITRRMRWLFLSIFIIYAWLTPGQALALPLMHSYETWLPTVEGITEGIMRALSLMLILIAVNMLLRCTTQQQLIMAIYWLAAPLHLLGVSRERISVRVALIVDILVEVQLLVSQSFAEVRGSVKSLEQTGHFAAGLFRKVIHNAECMPDTTIMLDGYGAPRGVQWLFPAAIWAIFISAGALLK